tara:strand:- start:56 stop:352 length:297 start_codon:yes stop_codon:yes gene_type:complete
MTIIKKFFNPILIVITSITLIYILQNNETARIGFQSIRYLQEFIKSKPLQKKSYINFKNTTKIIRKSYKGILAGGASVAFAANQIVKLKRDKNDEDNL